MGHFQTKVTYSDACIVRTLDRMMDDIGQGLVEDGVTTVPTDNAATQSTMMFATIIDASLDSKFESAFRTNRDELVRGPRGDLLLHYTFLCFAQLNVC